MRAEVVFRPCHIDIIEILLVIWGHKKYYVMQMIGRIIVTRVRNEYAGAGKSFSNLAKVLLLLPEMALFGHFCAKVNWQKYFARL